MSAATSYNLATTHRRPTDDRYQRVFVYLDVKRGKNNVINTSTVDNIEDEDPKRKPFWWEHEQERRIAEGLRPPLDTKWVLASPDMVYQSC